MTKTHGRRDQHHSFNTAWPEVSEYLSHRNLKSVSFPTAEGRDDARKRLITAWKRISGLWVLCVQEWDVLQSRRSHDLGHHLAALHIWGISGGQEERVYALISAHLTAHVHAAPSRLCRALRNKHTDRFYLLYGALRQTDSPGTREQQPSQENHGKSLHSSQNSWLYTRLFKAYSLHVNQFSSFLWNKSWLKKKYIFRSELLIG